MLLPGVTGYSFGSKPYNVPDTRLRVTSVAITGNVATLAVTLVEGLAPIAGSLISVQGTQTVTSGGAPNFNVTSAAIITVTGFNTGNNDTGTVTFALTSTNISTTADAGQAIVPVPAVADAAVTGNKGQQFAMAAQAGGDKPKTLGWFVSFGGAPAAVQVDVQVANQDIDSEYTTFDSCVLPAGQTRSFPNFTGNFVRAVATTITGGTSPTLVVGFNIA